jgi:hypothetical protein
MSETATGESVARIAIGSGVANIQAWQRPGPRRLRVTRGQDWLYKLRSYRWSNKTIPYRLYNPPFRDLARRIVETKDGTDVRRGQCPI